MTAPRPPGTCARCGLPAAARRPGAEAFCCTGCTVAWHLSGGALEGRADRLLARVVLSAFLSMGVMVFSLALWGRFLEPAGGAPDETARALEGVLRLGALALATPVVLLLGLPHVRAVLHLRRWLSADALVVAGTLSAFGLSAWNTLAPAGLAVAGRHVWFETASMVLVLYTLGKWMDARARDRARARVAGLSEPEPDALLVDGGGERRVPPASLAPGDVVRVPAGEPVPVDGVALAGAAALDASRLTGEERPRPVGAGDAVHAGTVVREGELRVRAVAVAGARLRDEVERLLAAALARRTPLVARADRVAALLFPAVLALALGALVHHARAGDLERGLFAALSVVLISCPCALGIATPLAFWTALGEAWRRGVLVRGGDALERLARARKVFLDKTGTLTSGRLALAALVPAPAGERVDVLALAAALEAGSEHPVGRAVLAAWRAREEAADLAALPALQERRVLPGVGVSARLDGRELRLARSPGGGVELSLAGEPLARLAFRAELRGATRDVVRELARRGLAPEVLTGDSREGAQELARELDVPFRAELLPADKLAAVRAAGPRGVVLVGDGLNDAPALAAADVGVSVAGAAAASLEAAEVHLLGDDLSALPDLLDLAARAVRTARRNLAWAFSYNALGLWLAASGRLTPVFAAAAMVASSALVVLSSSRLGGAVQGERGGEEAPARAPAPAT